jgi:hypothetical protein
MHAISGRTVRLRVALFAAAALLAAPGAAAQDEQEFACTGADDNERLQSVLADVESHQVKSWAGTAYKIQGRHLDCVRRIFGIPDTNILSVQEQRSYAQIRFAPVNFSDNVEERIGKSFFGVLGDFIKRAFVRDESTASMEMSIYDEGIGGARIGVQPLYAVRFSDKSGRVRDTQMVANGSLSPLLPLGKKTKVAYSVALKYYERPQINILSAVVNGAAIAAGFQATPTAALSTLTSKHFTDTANAVEAKLSQGMAKDLTANVAGELYLYPRPDQDAAVIFSIEKQKKRPSAHVLIYPHYEDSVFVQARRDDGVPAFAEVGRSQILSGPYAKLGLLQHPTINSFLSDDQSAILEQLASEDPADFLKGCDNLERVVESSFGFQYFDRGATVWAILENPELSYQRKEVRDRVRERCPSPIVARAIADIGKDFQPPFHGATLGAADVQKSLDRLQAAYDQLTDPRKRQDERKRRALATIDEGFGGEDVFRVTDLAELTGNLWDDETFSAAALVNNFLAKLAIDKTYERHGCGQVTVAGDGHALQAAEFLIATPLSEEEEANKFARVLLDLQNDKSAPIALAVNALDLEAARAFRDESAGCAIAEDFPLPGDAPSDDVDDAERSDALMAGFLDSTPAGFDDVLEEAAESGEFIGDARVAWAQPVVTVAFEEGDPELFALIEAAANEWTAHSDIFAFSFRHPDGSFRRWSRNDVNYQADIRISFSDRKEERGYWSYPGRVAREFLPPNKPTMNYTGFTRRLSQYYGGADAEGWARSYERSTILHEFGHALGLHHEHYHRECQPDLKFEPDPGYQTTLDSLGRYAPDPAGRSPGAVLAFSGPPNRWSEDKTRYALDFAAFLDRGLSADAVIQMSKSIDQRSVMLYSLEPFLLKQGENSPCLAQGDGELFGGRRFATDLSDMDIAYFKQNYAPRAPLAADAD